MEQNQNSPDRDLMLYKVFLHMLTETDEDHPESLKEVTGFFKSEYPSMSSRYVNKCISLMKGQGFRISRKRDGHALVYYSENDFSLWVFQTLVMLAESAKFLSRETTDKIINSLCLLTPKGMEERLRRVSLFRNTVKTRNNETAKSISRIVTALLDEKKISFVYYRAENDLQKREKGREIIADPVALIPDSDKLYLSCLPDYVKAYAADPRKKPLTFRIDNIIDVKIREEPLSQLAKEKRKTVEQDHHGVFNMFSGELCEDVQLLFPDYCLRSVYDRFGEDIKLKEIEYFDSGKYYLATVPVEVSDYFFWWILQSGGKMQILGPEWVKERQIDHLHRNGLRFADPEKKQSEAATPDCGDSEQK